MLLVCICLLSIVRSYCMFTGKLSVTLSLLCCGTKAVKDIMCHSFKFVVKDSVHSKRQFRHGQTSRWRDSCWRKRICNMHGYNVLSCLKRQTNYILLPPTSFACLCRLFQLFLRCCGRRGRQSIHKHFWCFKFCIL